jgi:hypothetical protein
MSVTATHFAKQTAPCERRAHGHHHVGGDDEGLSYDDLN